MIKFHVFHKGAILKFNSAFNSNSILLKLLFYSVSRFNMYPLLYFFYLFFFLIFHIDWSRYCALYNFYKNSPPVHYPPKFFPNFLSANTNNNKLVSNYLYTTFSPTPPHFDKTSKYLNGFNVNDKRIELDLNNYHNRPRVRRIRRSLGGFLCLFLSPSLFLLLSLPAHLSRLSLALFTVRETYSRLKPSQPSQWRHARAYHSLGSHTKPGVGGWDTGGVLRHLTRHSNEVVTRMPRHLINSD